MSKPKKRIVTTKKKTLATTPKRTRATTAQRGTNPTPQRDELVFGKKNYLLMAAGFGLLLLGLLLMSGGAQPDPTVWDEDIIYNWRRIVLAPAVILLGLGLEVYAIFVEDPDVVRTQTGTEIEKI